MVGPFLIRRFAAAFSIHMQESSGLMVTESLRTLLTLRNQLWPMDSFNSELTGEWIFPRQIERRPIMDELLQKALERRTQLRAELEAVERFIQSYEHIRESKHRMVHPDLFAPRSSSSPSARKRGRAKEIAATIDAAEEMILEVGRPLTRSQLLQMLEDAGHKIEGSDKSKVLGTNLWRSKRFHNLKGAGYWPLSKPIPEDYRDLDRRASMLIEED